MYLIRVMVTKGYRRESPRVCRALTMEHKARDVAGEAVP